MIKKLGQELLSLVGPNGFKRKIIAKLFQLPNGLKEFFYIDDNKDSVQVFCVTTGGDVVLVQQFRPNLEKEELELPGGGLNSDENPLHAGVRELAEETGYVGDATYMGFSYYSPYSTGKRHQVLVINAKKVENQHLDPNEFVTVLKISLKDFRNKIKTGEIRGYELGYMSLDYLGKL